MCTVQKQAEQLLQQNQQLLEYIGELVNCLREAKSISLNRLASSASGKVNCILREAWLVERLSLIDSTFDTDLQGSEWTDTSEYTGSMCAAHYNRLY